MRRTFIILMVSLSMQMQAQLLTEVSGETASYDLPSNKFFEQLRLSYSFYINKSDEFHDNCEAIKKNLVFINGYSRFSDTSLINWEVYGHPFEGKKCIKLNSGKRLFLNAEDASLLYYTSHTILWKSLPLMAQIKLRYAIYENQICNMAQFYKRSEVKGHVIRYNLCLQEKLIQGKMFGDAAVIAL